jgi:glucans biosynthesis protein C
MNDSENRFVYLDNIRNILVYNVVFVHTINMFAYPVSFWWPAVDITNSSRVYEIILAIMDIYCMPVMIFIAALFIFPSLKTRSTMGYMKKRFQRLVIPIMVFTLCAGDLVFQIMLTRVHGSSPDYVGTILEYWRDFLDFSFISYIGKNMLFKQAFFEMQHTWFLSFLFFMTLAVVLVNLLFRKKEKVQREVDTRKKIILKTIAFAVMAGFVYCVLSIVVTLLGVDINTWVRVLGLIQVRINQFWMLLLMFLFGLYMYRKEWLARGDIGSWKMWGALSLVFVIVLVLVYTPLITMVEEFIKVFEHNLLSADKIIFPEITESMKQLFIIISLTLMPACVFLLMFFLSFAKRFFNKPNTVTAFCSKHSINVYILHFVPIQLLQYTLLNVPIPPVVKIIAIMVVTIPACLWLSHRLVYPHPLVAIVLFAVLKLISLFTGFDFYYKALMAIIIISFSGALFEIVRHAVTGRRGTLNQTPS